ncbi:MAG TPA: hypothetical protein VFJ79_01245, partial [Acidimicrobiales bacterium]|nr:hypothetical protein [Acidimicrobiales bacterium]
HDKLVTAYHEAGHAIVGHVLTHADPIHKVSIVARSRSLGLTFTLPEDRYNHSRSQLCDSMAMALGGRTAEEIVFSEPTTGAENDIEKVTRIARAMVTEYGMSDALGPQQLGQRDGEVFLGRELGHQPNYSEEVAAAIDREVRGLIDQAHSRARAVLMHHRDVLDLMARELVEKETLDTLDLEEILGPLAPWPIDTMPTNRAGKAGAPAKPRRGGTGGIPVPVSPEPVAKPAAGGRRRRPLAAPGRSAPVGAATRSAGSAKASTARATSARTSSVKEPTARSAGSSAAANDRTPATPKRRGQAAQPASVSRAARPRRSPAKPSEQ